MNLDGCLSLLQRTTGPTLRVLILLPVFGLSTAGAPATAPQPNGFTVVIQGRSAWREVAWSIAPPARLALVLARDAESTARIRAEMDAHPTDACPATVLPWSEPRVPVIDDCVDAVVVGRDVVIPKEEVLRVLRPGGVLYSAVSTKAIRKPRSPDLDTWPVLLHDATNNAVSRDRRVGPPRHLQWQAGPLWTRNHHMLNSVSAVVADEQRVIAVIDQAPSASMRISSTWCVVARNAFNGLLLWDRPLKSWADWRQPFRSGPFQLSRLLAAADGRVFVPLEAGGAVSALDAATGKVLTAFKGTDGAEEILPDAKALFVIAGRPTPAQALAGPGWRRRKKTLSKQPYRRILLCLATGTGNVRWRWEPRTVANIEPLTLAADARTVCFQLGNGVVCLDRGTGRERWRSAGANSGRGSPRLMTPSTLVLAGDVVLWANGRALQALSATDGKDLWNASAKGGFRSPTDVFVIDGRVWTGPSFNQVRDLYTGQTVRTTADVLRRLQTAGHHHRCYREKAAGRFIICGKRGLEFLDTRGAEESRNNWVRGTCQYGVLPCNGLLITPPNCCGCYMEAKVNGLLALRSVRTVPPEPPVERRCTQGPAYRAPVGPALPAAAWTAWRSDGQRSAASPVQLAERLETVWVRRFGRDLTAPVAAEGRMVVADRRNGRVTAVRISDGTPLWAFRASGDVDTPPTCRRNLVIFGSRDGYVTCLQADNGALRWKFQAARAVQFLTIRDRLESVWPVPGSVLVHGDVVYAAAGRSSFLDGGMDLYALDVRTGAILHHFREKPARTDGPNLLPGRKDPGPPHPIVQNATDLRTDLAPDRADAFSMAGGNTNDVMTCDADAVFLRWKRYGTGLTPSSAYTRHLFSTGTLPDGSDVHRSHYVYGSGDFRRLPVAYSWIVNRQQPNPRFGYEPAAVFGLLLAFNDAGVWGVRRRGGVENYEAFFIPAKVLPADPRTPDFHPVEKGKTRLDPLARAAWRHAAGLRPRALVITAGDLLIAGMPGMPPGKPSADAIDAFEGRKQGVLVRLDPLSGREKQRTSLPAAPVWNGIAIDEKGRLLVSMAGGRVACLAGTGAAPARQAP